MSALIKYDQARQALAACRNVDDIKDIRDKSEAMRMYAKQANDTELEQWAAEIKLRAQRAIGEISAGLEKQKNQAALPSGGKSKSEALAGAGISTSTANRYEKLAAIPEPVIEEIIAKSKEAGKPVSAKAVMAQVAPKQTSSPTASAPVSAVAAAATNPTAPTSSTPTPTETELIEQMAELSEFIETLQASLKETVADNEMMGRVFDADDQLKAAMDEAARQKAIAVNAERTLAAKSGEFIERAKAVTYWKNRAEKAEKQLARLEAAA